MSKLSDLLELQDMATLIVSEEYNGKILESMAKLHRMFPHLSKEECHRAFFRELTATGMIGMAGATTRRHLGKSWLGSVKASILRVFDEAKPRIEKSIRKMREEEKKELETA